MKNKEFSRWLLGLGYVCLAIVLLINFVRQAPDVHGSNVVQNVQIPGPDGDRLNQRLEEERSLNRELKKMLGDYQHAYAEGTTVVPPQTSTEAAQPVGDIGSFLKSEIPHLNSRLFDSHVDTQSPFIPGKNPYVSFLPPVSSAVRDISYSQPSDISVRCDPKIPFLMKGNLVQGSIRESRGTGPEISRAETR